MKKVVYKTFVISDFQKEEDWLNEMAEQGYLLSKVAPFKYTFDQVAETQTVRMVYVDKNKKDFIEFVEETGAHYIGSIFNWAYFSKETEAGQVFQIFSDYESKIKNMTSIHTMLCVVTLINLLSFIVNIMIGLNGHSLNLYLSPISLLIAVLLIILTLKVYNNRQKLIEFKKIYE